MKKLLFFAAIFFTISAHSQTRFGIEAGAIGSVFKIKPVDDGDMKYKLKPGVKIGVFAEIPMSNNVFINPALNYVYKGGKATTDYDDEFGTYHDEYTISHNYLELPVNIIYKINGMNNPGLYFGAGPVLGYGLSGEIKSKSNWVENDEAGDDEDNAKVKFDGKKDTDDEYVHFKALEVGANVLVGYELGNGLSVQAQYRPNFSNLSPDSDYSYKNTYFGFSLRYRF